MSAARFISLEGLDGAGKTTQLATIRNWLSAHGIAHIFTREPGGTPLGEQLREMLLHQPMATETELLLMYAARHEHVHQLIRPRLAAGEWVISDRFADASFAYQGGGRQLDTHRLAALDAWTLQGFAPDLTLFLDVPTEVAFARLQHSREPDRFEQEAQAFHQRVRDAYLARAAAAPQRFRIIDASQPAAWVSAQIEAVLETLR